jgi:glycosyltransferase involved in cell wall biosynthesis
MTQLLGDETQRATLARQARERAEAAFGWDAVTRSYESLFAEVLKKTQPVP